MAKTEKTCFVCTKCGAVHDKWYGRCRECGEWTSLEEQTVAKPQRSSAVAAPSAVIGAMRLSDASAGNGSEQRIRTRIPEFDRALGGGIVKGSVILLSGEPGIGKSTLLLQICDSLGDQRILYVSGEESFMQIRMRASRLGVKSENLFVLCENDLEKIEQQIGAVSPDLVIVDSIQTVSSERFSSSPGSITQVRECSGFLIGLAKREGFASVLVGHVNKDGAIAGPKLLEHMVDVVLHFEGERSDTYRVIRAAKNRYGSTNEIGLFEMCDRGLAEVPDPSRRLLEDSPKNIPGSCPVCLMEGTRPIVAEIQALVSRTPFPSPKRLSSGVDFNRMGMILAVLEKRLGMRFFDMDVYLNVIGGLRLDDTAADMGVACALISCVRDVPLSGKLIAVGEIGLSGECRSVGSVDARIGESARLGFDTAVVPYRTKLKNPPEGMKLVRIRSVFELSEFLNSLK